MDNFYQDTSEDSGVLMFGMMGAGKSTVANTLLGKVVFEEGDGAESVTDHVQVSSVEKPGGGKLSVFDVPGLGDPDATRVNYALKFFNSLNHKIKNR